MTALTVVHDLDSHVVVRDGDVELLRYTYVPDSPLLESPKPYLHPLRTRAGHLVSLFRPHDHVWHKGIAWSLPVVGEENFWGGPTYVHGQFYVQLPNNGTQQHVGAVEASITDGVVELAHDLEWITEGGARIITERRRISARVLTEGAWALTFDTALTNASGQPIADHKGSRERRLRRAVLAGPAIVHQWHAGRAGWCERRRRGARTATRMAGLSRQARSCGCGLARAHGRRGGEPSSPAAVVRAVGGVRRPQPRSVLQRRVDDPAW